MATLIKQNNKNDVVDDIREAIQAIDGCNNKIQLLSLMCGTSEDSYKYSIVTNENISRCNKIPNGEG